MFRKTPHFARFHDRAQIEGWGAAVAVGVSAAASIGSAALSASAAEDAAGIAYPKPIKHDPVLAQQDQYAGIKGLAGAFQNYGGQAQEIANAENDWYRKSVFALAPGTKQGIYTASKQANQFLRGEIPADVQASIQRASAQSALSGGYGADSGMGRNLSARDFGLTSLDLQQRGLSQLGAATNLSKSLTPYSAGDILGTAQQYQANFDNYNIHNADVKNQAARDAAGAQNSYNTANYQQQVAAAQAPNPYVAGALAGLSSVGTALGSYAGRQAGQANYGVGSAGATPASYDYTAWATQNGVYNPYKDKGNYSPGGNFYGNPYSYG